MTLRPHIQPEPEPAVPLSSSGSGGPGGFDGRLSALEVAVGKVETELRHLATRAWVLGGVVGGMISAVIITLAVIRLFSD